MIRNMSLVNNPANSFELRSTNLKQAVEHLERNVKDIKRLVRANSTSCQKYQNDKSSRMNNFLPSDTLNLWQNNGDTVNLCSDKHQPFASSSCGGFPKIKYRIDNCIKALQNLLFDLESTGSARDWETLEIIKQCLIELVAARQTVGRRVPESNRKDLSLL